MGFHSRIYFTKNQKLPNVDKNVGTYEFKDLRINLVSLCIACVGISLRYIVTLSAVVRKRL